MSCRVLLLHRLYRAGPRERGNALGKMGDNRLTNLSALSIETPAHRLWGASALNNYGEQCADGMAFASIMPTAPAVFNATIPSNILAAKALASKAKAVSCDISKRAVAVNMQRYSSKPMPRNARFDGRIWLPSVNPNLILKSAQIDT